LIEYSGPLKNKYREEINIIQQNMNNTWSINLPIHQLRNCQFIYYTDTTRYRHTKY